MKQSTKQEPHKLSLNTAQVEAAAVQRTRTAQDLCAQTL